MGFIQDVSGASQRRDARAGAARQRTELQAGFDKAMPAITSGYLKAHESISPFLQAGVKANQLYSDTLGINGADARTAAQNIYMTDDILAKIRQADLKAQGRADNAVGRFDSGTGALADSAIRLKDYGGWQALLKGEGDKGGQFALSDAQLNAQEGNDVANLTYGNAQQMAGVTGQETTNVAGSRSILPQNLLSLGSVLVGGFTPGKSGATPFGSMASSIGSGARSINDLMRFAS